MSDKLPKDFDAERYASSHPDVALSGLSPSEHFRRFGRLLGRNPSGKGPAAAATRQSAASETSKAASPASASAKPETPSTAAPIIERPSQFEPAKLLPLAAPAKSNAPEDGRFSLQILGAGPFGSAEAGGAICDPLRAYGGLCSVEPPAVRAPGKGSCFSDLKLFQTGWSRIENAWFADNLTLRLMINGGANGEPAPNGWAIRAYQADASNPGDLRLAGKGVQLPSLGPVFHDIEMLHPLMPVLLELSDDTGVVQDLALLPFPSLLPGGVHAAELKALQSEANPIDAFWALSEMLLQEALGSPPWPSRSIADLSFGQSDLAILRDVRTWLSAIFTLPATASSEGTKPGRLRLRLPEKGIPTISALVSRRLGKDGAGTSTGPFLVAEDCGARPRWSVALPVDWMPDADVPQLQRIGRGTRPKTTAKAQPVHLAIVMSTANSLAEIDPADRPKERPTPKLGVPLTVLLESSDTARTKQLCSVLHEIADDAGLEIFVQVDRRDDGIHGVLDAVLGPRGWRPAGSTDLRELARSARHETLLTISDRVSLNGIVQLAAIWDLLNGDAKVASASCALLGEAIFKKQAVVQPASGGLFPARVSFSSSPRLGFSEPDVFQALVNMTYPVVANTFHCTLWRRDALAGLPSLSGPVPAMASDIGVGLDLMDAGFRNVCTTKVTARISGPYIRRDAIDPVGSTYLQPARWEDILSRVTVLRELF